MENEILCPKCKSSQITANKKGFSFGKAIVGGVLTGGIGLVAGTFGSSKVIITCLNCGHKFKPGQQYHTPIYKPVYAPTDAEKNKLRSAIDYSTIWMLTGIFIVIIIILIFVLG